MQDDKNTKVESKQEIVEDAIIDNETAIAKKSTADDIVPAQPSKSDTRYLLHFGRIYINPKLGYFVTLAV